MAEALWRAAVGAVRSGFGWADESDVRWVSRSDLGWVGGSDLGWVDGSGTRWAAGSDLLWVRDALWPPALVIALLVATAVLTWPRRLRAEDVMLTGLGPAGRGGTVGDADADADVSMWQQDPLLVYRRWRLRRDREHLLEGVLVLLDSMAPALAMGLPPARALALAAEATSSSPAEPAEPSAGRRGISELDRLTGSLVEAAGRGGALADVWSDWARLTRAPEIAFVASAWALSERHGAPLAVAVERAAAGLREARARQRKVGVAVAGPRATVTVLTVLPLTGPAFGLACGIDPASLYLGSRIGAVSAVLGVVLIVIGRLWCRRMIRKAVAS